MATRKATASKAAKTEKTVKPVEKKIETKAVEAEAVKAAVKTEEKKAEEVKTEAPAENEAEAKKAPAKKAPAKKAAVKESVVLQFAGKEINTADLMKEVKTIWTKELKNKAGDMKSVTLYVKPEEHAVYYVVNDEVTGKIAL